ncbi:MAG: DUF6144 family protein [Bryobacteraceae bacterium]|nr:DUF6144 family protein [Bryobacteraceae bacterium]
MDRKSFFASAAAGCCGLALFPEAAQGQAAASAEDREKQFVKNWMEDLFDSLDRELDAETKVRVMAGCGRGCLRRFSFKQEIAKLGSGSVEKLVDAYRKNFEVWREEGAVHIRYGAVSKGCYCPAARYHPARANDMHCDCTRATHQTIFETALGAPVKVEILETLRRGGKTCHFVARVG